MKGTTTDPVTKTMELLPLGPVMMIDIPGIDDEGELGSLRVRKSYQMLNRTDLAREIIRHRRTVRFVLRVDVRSERLPLRVKNTDAEVRLHDCPNGSQH